MKTLIICNNPYVIKQYKVNESIKQIENSLDNISHGYEETLTFKNALDYMDNQEVTLLSISPRNWASIQFHSLEEKNVIIIDNPIGKKSEK